jgi:hypothetical protein
VIRISTTTLEEYRRLLETEYKTEQELIDSLKGVFIPTWQMQAGTAWDALVLAPGLPPDSGVMQSGQFSFNASDVRLAKLHTGPGVTQVKLTKTYKTRLGPALVVAKVDHVHGRVITDVKAKFSTPDARDYESSLQWRFYLDIHEALAFRYLLCDFDDPKNGKCALRDILTFRAWPFSGMGDECQCWVNEFVKWAAERDLLPLLDRAGTT